MRKRKFDTPFEKLAYEEGRLDLLNEMLERQKKKLEKMKPKVERHVNKVKKYDLHKNNLS